MKKYFFFDIDGTLVYGEGEKQVFPDSSKYTIEQLQKKGHFVAIATGRSHAKAVDVMKTLGIHNMVHDGGNGYTIDDEIVQIEPLDKGLVLELIEECERKGFLWGISPENTTYRLCKDDRFMDFTHDVYLDTVVKKDLDPSSYPQIYKAYVACKAPREQELETLKKLPWCRFHETYLFVEPTEKANGIYKMMDYFHAPLEDVVVFGDDLNDLGMFDKRWFSIAMGNAKPQLKEKADYVTDPVTEDGVYKACVKFGWIDEKKQ
ncbi:MAG: HAD-IIB family hydrolase [Erysipelotrichaceae bacterium]|nr:HAD-IIB family hydrolase [Erysipelotrichaceae bacterium]